MRNWLQNLTQKPTRYAIGLMAGTSMDGIDGALVAIQGRGKNRTVRTLATYFSPYTQEEVQALHALIQNGNLADLVAWDAYLGERFAKVAHSLLQQNPEVSVDFIGSHGQTVWHAPNAQLFGQPIRHTLQIGQPEVIFARTGLPVVANFRTRDMALGGQGAPLVPFVDWLLLSVPNEHRATLNLGGMANLTLMPANSTPEQIVAFDTGPANKLIDLSVRHFTQGAQAFDPSGYYARQGTVQQAVLDYLLAHPYFQMPPPKSTGAEVFGQAMLDEILQHFPHLTLPDLCATLTELTARTIADALSRWGLSRFPIQRLIVSGGGVHNPVLMERIQAHLPTLSVTTSEEFGIDPDFKEAIAFAVLADCYLLGEPVSYPQTTGVSRPAMLGTLHWG